MKFLVLFSSCKFGETDGPTGMAKLVHVFLQNFSSSTLKKSDYHILGVASGRLPVSLKQAVGSSTSPVTVTINVTDLPLATSPSITCLRFYLSSTEVQGWVLVCGQTVLFQCSSAGLCPFSARSLCFS
jgi:hypothetical protein